MIPGSTGCQGHKVHEPEDKQTVPVSICSLFRTETGETPNLSFRASPNRLWETWMREPPENTPGAAIRPPTYKPNPA
jgi:hypothetical protein